MVLMVSDSFDWLRIITALQFVEADMRYSNYMEDRQTPAQS